jgi:tetratricopeptide (TPR) repeat protein
MTLTRQCVKLTIAISILLGLNCLPAQSQNNESLLIYKYSELIDRNPKDIESLLIRALLYRKILFYDEAIADFKAILRIDPNNREAKKELALTRKIKMVNK